MVWCPAHLSFSISLIETGLCLRSDTFSKLPAKVILVGQGHSTFMRNFIWKTGESLWLDTVDKSPNLPRPHHNLARYYGTIGNTEKEMAEYQRALELKRGYHATTHHKTHVNLALVYLGANQEDEAIKHLRKAIEIAPRFSAAYSNLAAIMIKKRYLCWKMIKKLVLWKF